MAEEWTDEPGLSPDGGLTDEEEKGILSFLLDSDLRLTMWQRFRFLVLDMKELWRYWNRY